MQAQLTKAAQELFVPIMLLDDDVQRVKEMIASVDRSYEGDFHRRLYVRCLFAMIEGGIFFAKGVLLQAAEESNRPITPDQRSLLEEVTYGIDDKGKIVTKPLFMKPKHNIQFVAGIIEDWQLGSLDLGKGTKGWADFSDCIQLRNLLTHPRPKTSMNVEDSHLAQLDSCYSWFTDVLDQFAKILYPHRDTT